MTRESLVNHHRRIVTAFAQGQVTGLEQLASPPEQRTTQVSQLFFTPDTVYKLCRADNEAFNRSMFDFGDPAVRRDFVRQDFALNRYFSPSVYQSLFGVRLRGTLVEIVPASEEADELVVVMRRLRESDCLTYRLLTGEVTPALLHRAGAWLARRARRYPVDARLRHSSFEPLMARRLADVASFCELGRPHLEPATSDAVLDWLGTRATALEAYLRQPPGGLVVGLDCHSDNFFIENGQVRLLDAFQIKPDWRLVDGWVNICRLGADVAVLGSEELLSWLLAGYGGQPLAIAPQVLRFYLVYAALIRTVLWIDAGRLDLAQRYLEYAVRHIATP